MRVPAVALALISLASPAAGQSAADSAGIRAAALDYAEGWYAGDATRMARAVHPELVKRIVVEDTASKHSVIQNMGATALVNGTRRGFGKSTPAAQQKKALAILDIQYNAAVVKLEMLEWVDYLQLARVDGRWVILNVLWARPQ